MSALPEPPALAVLPPGTSGVLAAAAAIALAGGLSPATLAPAGLRPPGSATARRRPSLPGEPP